MRLNSAPSRQNPPSRSSTRMGTLRLVILALLAFLAILPSTLLFIRHGLTGDVWWAWKAGQWMAVHHRILLANPASWNGTALAGKPWINLEWGWDALLYAMNPHLSAARFVLVLIACQVGILASVYWALRTIAPRLSAQFIALLAFVYLNLFVSLDLKLRAEIVSYIFFPLLLGILWRARESTRWLRILGPLAVVWANLHGSWLMIPGLMVLESVSAAGQRRWRTVGALIVWGGFVPMLAVIALTPTHLQTITYAIWLDRNRYITTYILEWQSANFHLSIYAAMAVALLAAWVWRAQTRFAYPWLLDVWLAGSALMFFRESRMVVYFGFVFILWIAHGLGQVPRLQDKDPRERRVRWRTAAVLTVAGALSAVVLVPQIPPQFLTAAMPSPVIRWINRRPHAGVFGPYNDGGYLIAHNVHNVYIDARADFFLYNSHRFQSYIRLTQKTMRPAATARLFHHDHVEWIVWPTRQMNANLLWFIAVQHWKILYQNAGWAVYGPPSS